MRVGAHHVDLRRLAFFLGEGVLWWLAFATTMLGVAAVTGHREFGHAWLQGCWAVAALELGFYLTDLHDLRAAVADTQVGGQRAYRGMGMAVMILGLLLGLGLLRLPAPEGLAGLGAAVVTALGLRAALPALERHLALRQRVFLVGEGRTARCLAREIASDDGAEVVGFGGLRTKRLAEQAASAGATTVVVATDDRRGLPTVELLRCRTMGLEVVEAATLAARVLHRLPIELVRPADLIYQDGFAQPGWVMRGRRLLSVASAMTLLLLVSPLALLAALAVRLDSPGPIFFRQRRVGRNGRPFEMVKFRTMAVDAETRGAQWAQRNDPRVTRVGRHLRRFRIDELPQLWNVLRGEMDLVGPRPERPEFVEQLRRRIPFYDLRHIVAPGITGYAQVKYPYAASVEEAKEKLQYDLYYVRHLSILLDIYILLLTARVVLFGRGAR